MTVLSITVTVTENPIVVAELRREGSCPQTHPGRKGDAVCLNELQSENSMIRIERNIYRHKADLKN